MIFYPVFVYTYDRMDTIVIRHDFQIIFNCIMITKGVKFLKYYLVSKVNNIWKLKMLFNCNISLPFEQPTVNSMKYVRDVEKSMSKKKSDVSPNITYTKKSFNMTCKINLCQYLILRLF